MKRVKKLIISFMTACMFIQPVMALETNDLDIQEMFKQDLELFYNGREFEFQDEEGNDITDEILSYKEEYYLDKENVISTIFNKISSYGETANITLTRSIKNKSYTWKSYRIKITNSALIVADIKVSASYDTSTKKIKNPKGSITVVTCTRNTRLRSYTTSTSFINKQKTIHYVFNVTAQYVSGLKTVKVTRNWTPKF